MNEKIKQLAKEAGFITNPNTDVIKNNHFGGYMDGQQFEKFAELIIQECVNTLDQQYVTISDDADPEDNKTWIGATMNTTVARCKHSILSNFGVAE